MNKVFQYLSQDRINQLLSPNLKLGKRVGNTNIYQSGKILIGYAESKLYEEKNEYWYSLFIDTYKEKSINDICLCLQNKGILLLKLNFLLGIKNILYTKEYPTGLRYNIYIKEEDKKYYLCNTKNKQGINLTKFFTPA